MIFAFNLILCSLLCLLFGDDNSRACSTDRLHIKHHRIKMVEFVF